MAFASASVLLTPLTLIGAQVTFSSTVICGKRLKFWNTIPILVLISLIFWLVTSSPSIYTSPDVGTSSKLMHLSIVDFPEPEGPTMHSTSASLTVWSMPLSTSLSPYDLYSFLISIIMLLLPRALVCFSLPLSSSHFPCHVAQEQRLA